MTRSRDIADSTKTLDVDGGTIKLDGNYPTGTGNVALGDDALRDGSLSGGNNTAIGHYALYANTSGTENTSVGRGNLDANTTGSHNTALGSTALSSSSTGSYNTALGSLALQSNTTASNNTAVGYQAGYANTTGVNNTAIGADAGKSITTAASNTIVGHGAGQNTNSDKNTFIGRTAGYNVTSGAKNTIIGRFNGNENGLDIRTSANNIVLSDGDGNPWGYRSGADGNWFFDQTNNNEYTLRVRQTGTGANPYGLAVQYPNNAPNNDSGRFITCSDSSAIRLKVFNNGNVQNQNNSYGSLSDEKLKENIVDSGSQWDDIKALTVRKYSLKEDNLDAPNMLGVIAQEVESAGMSGLVTESADEDINNNDLGTVTKSVNYSILYMKAVKALQEAMARIETLETKVATLEG